MLEPAYFHQEELKRKWDETLRDEEYCKFYNLSQQINYAQFNDPEYLNMEKYGICRVSIENNEILGFMNAGINYERRHVVSIGIVKFKSCKNPTVFMRDTERFIEYLFITRNFLKIGFSAVKNNTANKIYEAFIKKYNGTKVGVLRQEVLLHDNKYYDLVLYEILRDDFIRSKRILQN